MLKHYLLIAVAFLCLGHVKADEGMWLPILLSENESDMQKLGLTLSAEDLYSINNSSIKDAVLSLGGFCTAEVISNEGLVLTNHHCAYDLIQSHSSVKKDYLTDGFWAMNKNEELPNEGLSVSFLVRMENVTNAINEAIDSSSQKNKTEIIKEISKKITAEATNDNQYNARIKSFFGGNDYYLLVYETYNDVRLVGAPPSAIGKYGGDTDNWMWPRHTGDFALLRIYTAPDGSPAEYSKENIPLKPKHYFPVSLDGVSEGSFSMIMGFPGRTERYLTSFGVKQAIEQKNPTIVKIRDKKLAVMREHMDANARVKIQYSSKYASTANYWKYFIGQSKGLKRMNVYAKKQELESLFNNWVNADSTRKEKYGSTLKTISDAFYENEKINVNRLFLNEAIFQGPEVFYFLYRIENMIKNMPDDPKEKRLLINKIKDLARTHFKDYNKDLDQNLFSSMLALYEKNVPKSQQAEAFEKVRTHWYTKGDWDKFAKYIYKTSPFVDKNKFWSYLENPTKEKLNKDYAFRMFKSIYEYYLKNISAKRKAIRNDLKEGERLFIAGLREMYPNKNFYPDANSTLRLTYGTVGDYVPGDAMYYDYVTTFDGLMEKEDPNDEEFIVPEKLSELYYNKDYGRYADENGDLIINFISSNDITGGNSGSPVLNKYGHLIGTAFDGNWEAMSGDIAFENEIQRTISVDIRYILFVIDKFAGAGYLIDEMTVIDQENNVVKKPIKNIDKKNSLTIVKKLKTINYLGEEIPVLDMHSFGSAFDTAVEQFGSSEKVHFYWKGGVYTTEKK